MKNSAIGAQEKCNASVLSCRYLELATVLDEVVTLAAEVDGRTSLASGAGQLASLRKQLQVRCRSAAFLKARHTRHGRLTCGALPCYQVAQAIKG